MVVDVTCGAPGLTDLNFNEFDLLGTRQILPNKRAQGKKQQTGSTPFANTLMSAQENNNPTSIVNIWQERAGGMGSIRLKP